MTWSIKARVSRQFDEEHPGPVFFIELSHSQWQHWNDCAKVQYHNTQPQEWQRKMPNCSNVAWRPVGGIQVAGLVTPHPGISMRSGEEATRKRRVLSIMHTNTSAWVMMSEPRHYGCGKAYVGHLVLESLESLRLRGKISEPRQKNPSENSVPR